MNFNFGEVLAFPLVGSGKAFDFSEMGFESFGILIKVQCFVVLHGFEFLFLIKTGNQFHDILAFLILHIEVVVFEGKGGVLDLCLESFEFEVLFGDEDFFEVVDHV